MKVPVVGYYYVLKHMPEGTPNVHMQLHGKTGTIIKDNGQRAIVLIDNIEFDLPKSIFKEI